MTEQDRNAYIGILATVVIGMVLIYLAYLFVGFLLAHIWSILGLFFIAIIVWFVATAATKPKSS
jgi:hypothetical protein